MYLFKNLNQLIEKYLPQEQIIWLKKAYIVAREAHAGQIRSSGENYITHPIAVACILAEMKLDYETIMAALLHDVIEDTPATYKDMKKLFGKNVALLVEGVSKLYQLKFRDKEEEQVENFRKMILAMMKDIRVILIKLADRTHNMRTIESLRPDKRKRIAIETLEIYSPLAHRLGIHNFKNELEELGFKVLYPNRYYAIKKLVTLSRDNREYTIQKIVSEIIFQLNKADITCKVAGREKHLYSIYQKLSLKEKPFNSIMDIYSFCIIVKDIDTCYRVLGQMHNLYKPLPGRVKDYIAIPKANGYQSLHASMIGKNGILIEVHIYTEYMEQIAKMGIAAHWAYTNMNKNSNTPAQIRTRRWLKSLLELQHSLTSSFDFLESVKSDLFPEEIYVFTPKGCIIELPVGATPVDFAYAVDTHIGHACIGAIVNNKSYPLSKSLMSGQTIEIVTDPQSWPNASWLNSVVSSKARIKIGQILKNLNSQSHNSNSLK